MKTGKSLIVDQHPDITRSSTKPSRKGKKDGRKEEAPQQPANEWDEFVVPEAPHKIDAWSSIFTESRQAIKKKQQKDKKKYNKSVKATNPFEVNELGLVQFKGGSTYAKDVPPEWAPLKRLVDQFLKERKPSRATPAPKLEVIPVDDGEFKFLPGSMTPSAKITLPFEFHSVSGEVAAKFIKNIVKASSQAEANWIFDLVEVFHPIVAAALIAIPHSGEWSSTSLKSIPPEALHNNIIALAALTHYKAPITGQISQNIEKRLCTDVGYQSVVLDGFPPIGSRPVRDTKEGKKVPAFSKQRSEKGKEGQASIAARNLEYAKAPVVPKIARDKLPAVAWCSTSGEPGPLRSKKSRQVKDSGKDTVEQADIAPIVRFYSQHQDIDDQIIPSLKALPDEYTQIALKLKLTSDFDTQLATIRNMIAEDPDSIPNPNGKVELRFLRAALDVAIKEETRIPTEKVKMGIVVHPADLMLVDKEVRQLGSKVVASPNLTPVDEGSGIAILAEVIDIYAEPMASNTFEPNYFHAPFIPDAISVKAITDAKDSGNRTAIIAEILCHRFMAGCGLGQLNRLGKELVVIIEKPVTHPPKGVFLTPRMNIGQFGFSALKGFIDNLHYEINTKSSAGPLWANERKSLGRTYIDLLYLKQISDNGWKLPAWLKEYQFKPKLENTKVADMFAKTRSIFVMSSCLSIPMAYLTKGIYDYAWDWSDLSSYRAVIKTRTILCVTQQDFLLGIQALTREQRAELAEYAGGISLIAYSDNLYAIDWLTGEVASFDGVAMESQISASTIRAIQTFLKGAWRHLGSKKLVYKCQLEPGRHKNPFHGLQWDPINPYSLAGKEVLVNQLFKVFGYMEELEVEDAGEGYIHIVGSQEPNWVEFDKVFDMYVDLLENGRAVAGSWKFPISFLPSGWYWTTLCNTLVTLSYIEEIKGAGLKTMEEIRDYVRESRSLFKYTVENEANQSVFNENAHLDFLGFDIKDGGVSLRTSSLFSGPFEHNPGNRGADSRVLASLTGAKWISNMYNGGVAYPELVYCFYVALSTLTSLELEVNIHDLDDGLQLQFLKENKLDATTILEKAAEFCGYAPPEKPAGVQDTVIKFRATPFQKFSLRSIAQPNRVLRTAVAYLIAGVDPRNPRRQIVPGGGVWSAYLAELAQLARNPVFGDKSIVRLLTERHPILFAYQNIAPELTRLVVNAVVTNYQRKPEVDKKGRGQRPEGAIHQRREGGNPGGPRDGRSGGAPFGKKFPVLDYGKRQNMGAPQGPHQSKKGKDAKPNRQAQADQKRRGENN